MASAREKKGISRRTLLIGGGAGVGLLVAWRLWPRSYAPNLRAAPGETLFNAYLKIGTDGRVVVAVPQTELGQGVWTALPQILADELGADWRTVAVEPAPLSPLYANRLLAEEAANDSGCPASCTAIGRWAAQDFATPQRADDHRRLDLDPRLRGADARGGRGRAGPAHHGRRPALERRLGGARHAMTASSGAGRTGSPSPSSPRRRRA